MRFPTGFSPGQNSRAETSLMMATGMPPWRSSSLESSVMQQRNLQRSGRGNFHADGLVVPIRLVGYGNVRIFLRDESHSGPPDQRQTHADAGILNARQILYPGE